MADETKYYDADGISLDKSRRVITMREVDRVLPYDPNLREENLEGVQKLRAVADRDMAQCLLELWDHVARNEDDPEWQAREKRRAEAKRTKERERRLELADAARRGEFGLVGKEAWHTITGEGHDTSDGALSELVKALRGKERNARGIK